jgi:hypothetical protein
MPGSTCCLGLQLLEPHLLPEQLDHLKVTFSTAECNRRLCIAGDLKSGPDCSLARGGGQEDDGACNAQTTVVGHIRFGTH